MGTDIHLRVEIKNRDGVWEALQEPIVSCWHCKGKSFQDPADYPNAKPEWHLKYANKPCRYCTQPSYYSGGYDTEWEEDSGKPFLDQPGKIYGHWYDSRNYNVFSILADVRNGYGVAGADTGDGFEPISSNRGIPDDIAPQNKQWMEEGDHSTTWVTLDEVDAYDWERETTKRGWVTPSEFLRFKIEGRPSSWSGSVMGGNVKHISNDEMLELCYAQKAGDSWGNYTNVEWQESYRECAQDFLDDMDKLREATRFIKNSRIRLIMWFDS